MSVKSEKLSKTVRVERYQDPSVLMVNLKKFPDFEYKDVGDKCSGNFEGVITRISKDEYGQNVSIEIKKLEHDSAKKSKQSEDEYGEDE